MREKSGKEWRGRLFYMGTLARYNTGIVRNVINCSPAVRDWHGFIGNGLFI